MSGKHIETGSRGFSCFAYSRTQLNSCGISPLPSLRLHGSRYVSFHWPKVYLCKLEIFPAVRSLPVNALQEVNNTIQNSQRVVLIPPANMYLGISPKLEIQWRILCNVKGIRKGSSFCLTMNSDELCGWRRWRLNQNY